MKKQAACKSCHWGRALVAGLSAGVSAGLFMRSKKGEKMNQEARQAAQQMQKELMKKWKQTEHFSQAEYDTMVKEIVGHYQRANDFAVDETADVQEFLLGQWKTLKKELLK